MDSTDHKNLRFLINADTKTLAEWYNSASDQDIAYASQLLSIYSHYLDDQLQEMAINQAINNMPVLVEAQAVIAAVR